MNDKEAIFKILKENLKLKLIISESIDEKYLELKITFDDKIIARDQVKIDEKKYRYIKL